jgi:hypothetical protein
MLVTRDVYCLSTIPSEFRAIFRGRRDCAQDFEIFPAVDDRDYTCIPVV